MSLELDKLNASYAKAQSKKEKLAAILELADYYSGHEYVKGWKAATEALELATKLDDSLSKAKAYEALANSSWKLAEYTLSLEHYANGLEIYRTANNEHGVARCFCGMGIICGTLEEYSTALEYFQEALVHSKKADRPELAASITGNIGHVYFNFGQYQKAMDYFKEGLEYFDDPDNSQGAANMISGMAGVHVYLGEYERGLKVIKRALDIHTRTNHERGIAVSRMNLGIAYLRMGNTAWAEKELLEALEYVRSINLKMTEHDILSHLVELYTELGKPRKVEMYQELYDEGMKEEKRLSVLRKNEQVKQRAQIKAQGK